MKKALFITIAVAFTSLVSCKKSDSTALSNSTAAVSQMSYQIVATNKTTSVAKTTAPLIQWTTGVANPVLVKFEAKQGTTAIEYKSSNTSQIDLMASVASSFGSFTIPNGTYNEIEVKLQMDKNGSTPALQLQGQFSNGVLNIPVQLMINEFVEIKTEQKNVTVTDSSSFIAITTLDFSLLINGITEAAITSGTLTSGTLVISSNSNKALYDIVLNNLKNKSHHCEIESHHK
jgi:hypothetical protein